MRTRCGRRAAHRPALDGRPGGSRATATAEEAGTLTEERDRIAQCVSDVVVHRLFAAGLDLHAALGLVCDHLSADRIDNAIGELDQAIMYLRDATFDHARATAAAHPKGGHV